MAEILKGYPHDCTDEQIRATIASLSNEIFNGPNINTILAISPLISLGQNELQRRIVAAMGKTTEANLSAIEKLCAETSTLKEITSQAAASSDQSSKTSVRLTRINVWLTVLMLGLSAVQIIRFEITALASPKLKLKFVNGKKAAEGIYSFELRMENLGNKFADGAYVHFLVPETINMKIASPFETIKSATNPTKTDPYSHFEIAVNQKFFANTPTRLGEVIFYITNQPQFIKLIM